MQEGQEPAERPKRSRVWRRLWAALRPWLKGAVLVAQLGLIGARIAQVIRSWLL